MRSGRRSQGWPPTSGARDRLARAALAAVADRTWDRALARLAAGYRTALAPADSSEVRHAA